MNDNPSERLVEQRLRNRIMEELHHLADWKHVIPDWGAGEYFCSFFDFVPEEGSHENSAITPGERTVIEDVRKLMIAACAEMAKPIVDSEPLLESGWPQRIEPVARSALLLMWRRGQFSEDAEEDVPSLRKPWDGYGTAE